MVSYHAPNVSGGIVAEGEMTLPKLRSGSITVIGDLAMDVTARVPIAFGDITRDTMCPAAVTVAVGGSAANFAVAAAGLFVKVHLITAVGMDSAGEWLIHAIEGARVEVHAQQIASRPTRVVMVIRDGGPRHGTRLMVPGKEVANTELTKDVMARLEPIISNTDLLMVDGYSLLAEPRRSASLHGMHMARDADAEVAVDIVPHNLYTRWSVAELMAVTNLSTIVISEVDTLLGFMGSPPLSEPTEDAAATTIGALREMLGPKMMSLRFGVGNIDQSLLVRQDGTYEHTWNGYINAPDTAGFGDRLSAREMLFFMH
jgi:sugar/nucleoside kinase (ribokinase family)